MEIVSHVIGLNMIERIGQVMVLSLAAVTCLFFCGCKPVGPWADEEVVPKQPAIEAKVLSQNGVMLGELPGAGKIQWSVEPSGIVHPLLSTAGERLDVELPVEAQLVFKMPKGKTLDISRFTHISFDIYNRDDIGSVRVGFDSSAGSWQSKRYTLKRGKNTVRIAIHRLWRRADFSPAKINSIAIDLPGRFKPVNVELGNVKLENLSKQISQVPKGFKLIKIGGDYSLSMPGERQVDISRGDDGLWRFGLYQPIVRLGGVGHKKLATGGEDMEIMGSSRVGKLELIEHNSLRIRFRNSWFFLGHDDQIKSASPRHIIWDHTIYSDGRWLCDVRLDNAGGREIDSVMISMISDQAAWYGGKVSRVLKVNDFIGPEGRWNYMLADKSVVDTEYVKNYMNPGKVILRHALANRYAGGDIDFDRFDQSQGCYYIAGESGGARFDFIPTGVAQRPVFVIAGPWKKLPAVSVAGMKIREIEMLSDSNVLFILPGFIKNMVRVEVFGESEAEKKP